MATGRSVQLYLVDGTPGGLVTAEIVNWTGKILSCPRSQLNSLLKRDEVSGTGVYILLGDNPDDPAKPFVYIGETDDVRQRLKEHSKNKDFWDRVVTVTNKDLNLTKAHVRFLEHRMIVKAKEANRSKLENGNDSSPSQLPEAAKSDMEQFLDYMELVLPLVNVNVLRSTPTKKVDDGDEGGQLEQTQSPDFELFIPTKGIRASAQEIDGEFVVYAGSQAVPELSPGSRSYRKLRQKLVEDGTLVLSADSTKFVFTRNQIFASPSAAAGVVRGHSANGRAAWKEKGTGQTYAAWQDSLIDAATLGR